MSEGARVWVYSAATLLAFVLLAWLGGFFVDGTKLWILRGCLLTLGLVAAGLVFWYSRAAARKRALTAHSEAADDPLDGEIRAAQDRLESSKLGGTARLDKLPLLLVLGPTGSAKTSVIVHSGTEPELLAGEVYRGDAVMSTRALNVWYARDTLIVEAGGNVVAEPPRWNRLLGHIQPSRLAAVLAHGQQAPRTVLVCFPCDEILKPAGSSELRDAAVQLRERLLEASQQLGIRLPVYVLFTRADRIPHFEDYVRSLSRAEAQEVLGVTLPASSQLAPRAYAEQESGRLIGGLREIFHTLALKRVEVLPREASVDVRAEAYEFPREFRKLSDSVVEFLLELCRPSQLSTSPFLRGFYFTGVRPVVIDDGAAGMTYAPPTSSPGGQIPVGATGVFNPQLAASPVPTPAVQRATGSRRVPEWTFLKRLFPEVILADRAAMSVTGGGTRVTLAQRASLVAAAALFLILSTAFTVSYVNNRRLVRDAVAGGGGALPATPVGSELPDMDELRRLDQVRGQAALLRSYEEEGVPLRLRWGMYTGSELLPLLRRQFHARFDRLLWRSTNERLLATLQAQPESPNETSEYGTTYDALKVHLMTTSHPQHSTPEFLTPLLQHHWSDARDVDAERSEIAERQFAFFAEELALGIWDREEPDAAVVEQTRSFLQKFAGAEQFYQLLISEAGKGIEPVQFERLFPGTGSVVRNSYVVPAAFTRPGWPAVQTNLDNLDRLFAREEWVVGSQAVTAADRAKLASELRARYVADYIRHWQAYLVAGSVAGYGGSADAAKKLEILVSNDSPLLRMISVASQNTAVDTTVVSSAFQPAHAIVPPGANDRLIGEANSAYVEALGALQAAFQQAATADPAMRAMAAGQVTASAEAVQAAIRNLAQNFDIEGGARPAGAAIERLLREPLGGVRAIAGALPASDANRKGAIFCRQFRQVMQQYPFNPATNADASIDDVSAMFQPGSSALWEFYGGTLSEMLARQGSRYAPRLGVVPQPTSGFVRFFNRAADVSEALYDAGGAGPRVVFTLRPQTSSEIPEVVLDVNGRTYTFTRTRAAAQTIEWTASRSRSARITATVNGTPVTVADAQGPWAVFRLFQRTRWQRSGEGRYVVSWPSQAGLTAEVRFADGIPVFDPASMNGLDCVSRVAG